MPRLSVPKHLVRNPVEAARDATRFDWLCSLAINAAREVVPLALIRRTAQAGLGACIDEAKSVLKFMVKEPELLDELPEPEQLSSLVEHLSGAIADLSPDFVEEQADDLGRVMMSSWVDCLKASLETYPLLVLANDLLPARVPDPALMEEWREAIEPFGVNDSEVARLMHGIRQTLTERGTVELPLNMKLWAGETAYGSLAMITPTVLPKHWHTDLDLARLQTYTDCDFSWLNISEHGDRPTYLGHALGIQAIVQKKRYVYPREVESVLYACPGVAEATIIGIPKRLSNEAEVKAIVQPAPGARVSESTIVAHCEAKLEEYQRPATVVFTDALPRDQSGKLVLSEIMEKFAG